MFSSSQIKSNGDCLYRSIWSQMVFEDDERRLGALLGQTEQGQTFTPYRLRLFIVRQMLAHMDNVSFRADFCLFVLGNIFSCVIRVKFNLFVQDQEFLDDITNIVGSVYGVGDPNVPGPFTLEEYIL